jgi:catalase-peroxidase
MSTQWKPTSDAADAFDGCVRAKGDRQWSASRVYLIFGSNSELRALAEVYGSDDAKEKFVNDFVNAWTKVMNLDRFDIPSISAEPAVT